MAVSGAPAGYTVTPRTLVVEAAAAGRSFSVALPALRAWGNVPFEPVAGMPWIEEDYLPGPSAQIGCGPRGEIEGFPQYVLKLYVPAGTGALAAAGYVKALLALFAPRTAMPLTGSDVLRVRADPAPYATSLVPVEPGFAALTVTIPLRIETLNAI